MKTEWVEHHLTLGSGDDELHVDVTVIDGVPSKVGIGAHDDVAGVDVGAETILRIAAVLRSLGSPSAICADHGMSQHASGKCVPCRADKGQEMCEDCNGDGYLAKRDDAGKIVACKECEASGFVWLTPGPVLRDLAEASA